MGDNKNNGLRRWAVLSAIAIEMGVVIYLFVQGGLWLDAEYNDGNKLYVIIGTLLGVGLSLYLVVQQTNRLNK
ncbi:AtpZ/AtpI family protein [Marixanthomonas ophiurae]|uniref:AtpZ/AtpI family protein n=1 Tax=Marixanthomonas ophiurae TaxID=387659 RepID=A0A3E1QAI2_9FLAO|nr:AtpZ/AtpI family protein [Marixanthomonas ophiurae]RFN59142.1 AtpZ/AtpI family protein [Marixanthomonas ophiurae]